MTGLLVTNVADAFPPRRSVPVSGDHREQGSGAAMFTSEVLDRAERYTLASLYSIRADALRHGNRDLAADCALHIEARYHLIARGMLA